MVQASNQTVQLLVPQPFSPLKHFLQEKVKIIIKVKRSKKFILFLSGNVEVIVINPNGNSEKVDCRFNNDKNLTYSVSYQPKIEGVHKVFVKFNSLDIPKSPFEVSVVDAKGDASKVKVTGPGIQPDGVTITKSTYFEINAKDAGNGTPEVIILDPTNKQGTNVPAKLHQIGKEHW